MHYCVYVFIPDEGDIEEEVAKALRLYGDEIEVPPYKEYLDAGEITAMAKCYGVRCGDRKALAAHMDDWKGVPGGIDTKGLYAIKTFNPNAKWDWYEIGGRWEHFLSDVIGTTSLLEKKNLKNILPAAMVTPDGWWSERETFIVEGWMKWRTEQKKDGEWLQEVKTALKTYPAFRVVCVDVHR